MTTDSIFVTYFLCLYIYIYVFQGKKTRKFRRKRQNKYESQSKMGLRDPWDNAVAEANAKESIANKEEEEMKRLRREEKRKRGITEYPRIEVTHTHDYVMYIF